MAFFPDLANAFKIAPTGVIRQIIGTASKWRSLLRSNDGAPGPDASFGDIGNTVDGFKTVAYSEAGSTACP